MRTFYKNKEMKQKFLIYFLTVPGMLFSTSIFGQLNYADSLFESKKYTEAYQIYADMYTNEQASPAMLLRMAFIQEGLGRYVDAIYYLDNYYQLTADKHALTKIGELAEENGLQGYAYSDFTFFMGFVTRYTTQLYLLLVSLTALLMVVIVRARHRNIRPVGAALAQTWVLGLLFLLVNDFFISQKALVREDMTLLMKGPSAGADVIALLEKGHKVTLIDDEDAWIKISWDDQEGYIRKNRLLPL